MFQSFAPCYSSPLTVPAGEIERAALVAIAYGDVFDYALDLPMVHRYLHGIKASRSETAGALGQATHTAGAISFHHGYYTLCGREELVELRRQRAECADYLWPRAIAWGQRIARLPFVRMVAVTGGLAWSNVGPGADIDYLIIAEPGRVWIARALIAAVRRVAALEGIELCANYVLSSDALELTDRTVYTAYELANMVPISGRAVYRRMRSLNRWAEELFPNATGEPATTMRPIAARARGIRDRVAQRGVRLLERNLERSIGETIERWEMARCIRKRAGKAAVPGEALYSREFYKEHLAGHRHFILTAFAERLAALGLESSGRGL